jgi:hypothetical protein
VSTTWGTYAAALLLLAYAGAPKLVSTAETARAGRELGLPLVTDASVRLLGVVELSLAVAGFAIGGRVVALLVAASFLGFAVVTTIGLRRPGMTSCGCFSGDDSPPSVRHVLVDLGFAAAAVAAVVSGAPSVAGVADRLGSAQTAGLLALAVVVAVLGYVVLARFPEPAAAATARADRWADRAGATA